MPALSRDRYERRRWRKALKLLGRGVAPRLIFEATGVKRSTFYYRLAKERALTAFMADMG